MKWSNDSGDSLDKMIQHETLCRPGGINVSVDVGNHENTLANKSTVRDSGEEESI